MDKIMKSQILKLLLIAILVLITPLISSSQRTPYLYFIVNLLIISLGVDAGLITFFSKSQNYDDKNSPPSLSPQQQKIAPKLVEKCVCKRIVGVTKLVVKDEVKLQKCPPTPSLFFIGSGEDRSEAKEEEGEEEEISGEELFNKAEIFIGNFYNQLKMQREASFESLKRVRFVFNLEEK